MHTKDEIETRLAAIKEEMEKDGVDLDALTEEVRGLKAEMKKLDEAAEKRAALRQAVAGGAGQTVRNFKHEEPEKRIFGLDSKEYRNAWLKAMQGKDLTGDEQRAFVTNGSAIATMTANSIMDIVRQHAWLLERCSLIYSDSQITYYIEGDDNEATDHNENDTITPAADTLTKVDLAPAEITKLIQISDAARRMSIDAFEAWIAKHLGRAIARKINKKLITAASAAAKEVGSKTIDAAGVQALLGAIKGNDIALVCNNNTLFTKLLPLQDDSKNALVRFEGNKPTIYGRPVELDDNMADGNLLGGDWSKMGAAIAEDINIKQQFDINTNSYKYLGVTVFDCKVGINAAFAKIASA